MDATELLAREDEFKRLNKQLEKKTESLMKEIENVMQKQDFFSEFSPSLMLRTPERLKNHCCMPLSPQEPETPVKNKLQKKIKKPPKSLKSRAESTLDSCDSEIDSAKNKTDKVLCECCVHPRNNKSEEMEFLHAFVSLNVKDKVLPQSFAKEDKVSVESVCKFLSSKIKLMQEQMDKLQYTIEKKASQCESHLTQLAELESERMSLLNKSNNMKSSAADMRAKYMVLQKRYEEKEKQYKEQRTETDKLSCEVKRVRSALNAAEARAATYEHTADQLRGQLDVCKTAEKELRESSRQSSNSYESAIARLELRVSAQSTRLDKQAALIHNLRKQNALLAAEGAVDALAASYSELLHGQL